MDIAIVFWIFPLLSLVWSVVMFTQDWIDYRPGRSKVNPVHIWYFYLLAPYLLVGATFWSIIARLLKKE